MVVIFSALAYFGAIGAKRPVPGPYLCASQFRGRGQSLGVRPVFRAADRLPRGGRGVSCRKICGPARLHQGERCRRLWCQSGALGEWRLHRGCHADRLRGVLLDALRDGSHCPAVVLGHLKGRPIPLRPSSRRPPIRRLRGSSSGFPRSCFISLGAISAFLRRSSGRRLWCLPLSLWDWSTLSSRSPAV